MIIEVVGKEIEKIKGDFESYLNGLNMVGEISYSQYSELYDEGTKQIQRAYELGKSELEKENADLQKSYEELYNSMRVIKDQRNVLEKENVELKDKLKKWKDGIALKDEEIGCIETEFNTFKSEAKEIIREFVEWATWQGNSKCPSFKDIQYKAEQFLSEVEK